MSDLTKAIQSVQADIDAGDLESFLCWAYGVKIVKEGSAKEALNNAEPKEIADLKERLLNGVMKIVPKPN